MPTVCPPPRTFDPARLRELREARGLGRERLAAAAGISSRTIARAELREAQPQPVVVAALAAALGVSIESITNGEGRPQSAPVEGRRGDRRHGEE